MNNHESTLKVVLEERVSAIIRTDSKQLAADAMTAAVEGGFKLVEFTLTTPGALELIADFSTKSGLVVGAGTVMTTDHAQAAMDAGASFIVSPIVDPAVIGFSAERGAVTIPGAQTPTEMETAHRAGADLIKIFPAPAGGVNFIRAIRGPLPHLRLFPTNGVDVQNLDEYLAAGCAGAGFVRTLFTPEDLSDRNFSSIHNRAVRIIAVRDATSR